MIGNGTRLRVVRQSPRRLIAVHPGHDDVHEDEIRTHLARQTNALGAIGRGRGLVAVALERPLHDMHLGGRVIDDEYQRHLNHLPICVSIAFSSSSFVKGLVR